MHFSAAPIIAFAALAVQSSLALVIPQDTSSTLEQRAPHFFQVREPAADYTLYSPTAASDNATGSFEFKALDGEQSSEYHCKVYLQSSSGSRTEVANIPFDGYVAAATIKVSFDKFPDGDYTLVAEEFKNADGSFADKITQPFHIKQGSSTSSA
ncbi:hypothetical protein P389DRAFT_174617 [Cystobasidium minutum MCA 4210]|uniref:uncharacterized protein n=1 Tax=Cystobasidium minutum MCA 4210 TaxID=1397322 RepID=UPI0034CD1697|eukprot:jgi/Rhomi1/174617/fgenesh1_kg.8_\